MKPQFRAFLSGALCSALVLGLAVSALAISGRMTIEVDPINIQVNGETFAPTDVNGNEVPVFAYNGTTYAPLRALAEAYGLEVGYDSEKKMATVADPDAQVTDAPAPDTTVVSDYSDWSAEDEAAYQEFKEMWEYTTEYGLPTMRYTGAMQADNLVEILVGYGDEKLAKYALRARTEFVSPEVTTQLVFTSSDDRLLIAIYPDGRLSHGSIFSA